MSNYPIPECLDIRSVHGGGVAETGLAGADDAVAC